LSRTGVVSGVIGGGPGVPARTDSIRATDEGRRGRSEVPLGRVDSGFVPAGGCYLRSRRLPAEQAAEGRKEPPQPRRLPPARVRARLQDGQGILPRPTLVAVEVFVRPLGTTTYVVISAECHW